MKLSTRIFGEISIDEEKIIFFNNGIIGFPQLKKFALIHDEETGSGSSVRWMQSLDEPTFAMPVMEPLIVCSDYNPTIEDELIKNVGEIGKDNLLVLVTLSVPEKIEAMSINLMAPIIINADTMAASQVIAEGETRIKYPIYELLKLLKDQSDQELERIGD